MSLTAENILLVGSILLFISIFVSKAGAKIGVPLAFAGNAISGVGTGIEIGVSVIDGDLNKAGTKTGTTIAGKVIDKGLNKVLPGSANIYNKNFNIDKAILTQGASLKVNIFGNAFEKQVDKER